MTPQQNLTQDNEKRIRLVRPSIILLCGPAACGKSTFAGRRFRPTQIISSDWARAAVCDDEKDQRYQAQAFDLVHHIAELRLGLNRLCVVDSTGLTSRVRKEYLDLARKFGVPCVAILFDVPLEKCVERDQSRARVVGRPVIERQFSAFEQAKTEIRQEGFDEIIVLRDEDLDKLQIEIIFRPVSQPVGTAGRPAHGANRHTLGPRQEQNARGPAMREVKAPSTTPPPEASRQQAKSEAQGSGEKVKRPSNFVVEPAGPRASASQGTAEKTPAPATKGAHLQVAVKSDEQKCA